MKEAKKKKASDRKREDAAGSGTGAARTETASASLISSIYARRYAEALGSPASETAPSGASKPKRSRK